MDPTAPKPFLDVIKGAREQPGFFPIWRKDEKVWLEIPKAAFNKPFLAQPIGEGVTSLGVPIGFGVILFTVLITAIYVRKANSEFDRLTREILKETAQ